MLEGFVARLSEVIGDAGGVRALANTIDISRPAVQNWLMGSHYPDLRGLHNLRTRCGIDLNWLVTGEPTKGEQ